MLGARAFMLLNGEREPRTGRWTRAGSEGAATFLHLLGKGILTPPRREQLRAVSPVALVMQQPSERFESHGANGHHEENWGNDGTDGKPWAFDRLDTYWAMAPLPATDVATVLWGRARRDASHLPATAPHGFVCLLPGANPQTAGRWTSVWTTGGDQLSKDGKEQPLAGAREAILADLANGAQTFPFRVEGQVFHQIVEQGPGHFAIALVDPGWLNPADRSVLIRPQAAGAWSATDRLTAQQLGALGPGLALTVPAGTLRVLDLRIHSGNAPVSNEKPNQPNTFMHSRPLGQPWSEFLGTLLTASYYRDGVLLSQFLRQGGSDGNEAIFEFLWRDTTLQPKPVESLPLTRYFGPPFGWMIARTGWGDDAVIAEMKINETNFANHRHLDLVPVGCHARTSNETYFRKLLSVILSSDWKSSVTLREFV
jgi:hypothetical protein